MVYCLGFPQNYVTAQKRMTILHLISTIFSYYKIAQISIKIRFT